MCIHKRVMCIHKRVQIVEMQPHHAVIPKVSLLPSVITTELSTDFWEIWPAKSLRSNRTMSQSQKSIYYYRCCVYSLLNSPPTFEKSDLPNRWEAAALLGTAAPAWAVAVRCSVLPCVAVCCSVLHCVAVCCSVLSLLGTAAPAWAVAVCGSVLPCVAVCCSVLQCVAVCYHYLAQLPPRELLIHTCQKRCVAVCCSALQCVAVCCSVLQCFAMCCRVLQCVAVCCSVLQCVAVCCSVLQCVETHVSKETCIHEKKFPDFISLSLSLIHCLTDMHTLSFSLSLALSLSPSPAVSSLSPSLLLSPSPLSCSVSSLFLCLCFSFSLSLSDGFRARFCEGTAHVHVKRNVVLKAFFWHVCYSPHTRKLLLRPSQQLYTSVFIQCV